MSEMLEGGPCDGEEIELHPRSNYFEVHVHHGTIIHVYRRQMLDITFQPNPLLYAGSEDLAKRAQK